MIKKISFSFKDKDLNLKARTCGVFGRIRGLMFRSAGTENLVFEFAKSTEMGIHSFFVFFPFVAVWLDGKEEIVQIKLVKPFTLFVKSRKKYNKLIEIPVNKKNYETVKFLVGE